jgi:hypothetical protein
MLQTDAVRQEIAEFKATSNFLDELSRYGLHIVDVHVIAYALHEIHGNM